MRKIQINLNKLPTPKIKYKKVIKIQVVGPKDLGTPAYFISRPRPMPRRKKCPRIRLSSANQNHGRGKRHVDRGSPLEHPKGSSKPNGPAIGAW